MIKHQFVDGILIIHLFTCRRRLPSICEKVRNLMRDDNFTSGMVIVNFHSQVDWDDYHDFVAESDRAVSRIHSIGILVNRDELLAGMDQRAEVLRVLGIDTKVFRSVTELEIWAESKLPGRTFEELAIEAPA